MPKQAIEAALGHSGSKSCCSEVKAVALATMKPATTTPVTTAPDSGGRRDAAAMPNNPPMTTRIVSRPRMKSGRVRCSPLSTLSIISAWMSTPGTAVSSGVARKSWSALAVAPMSTMAPSIGFGSNSPARMRQAAMRRSGRVPA